MIPALSRLQHLWYLILSLAVASLIADITLVVQDPSILEEEPFYDMMPLPLVPDISTIFIFAYLLWGRSNPFLLPGSHPNSKPWARKARFVLSMFLITLWAANSTINARSSNTARRVMAAGHAFQVILSLIELIARHRLSRHQRRAFKQEQLHHETELSQLDNKSSDHQTTESESPHGNISQAGDNVNNAEIADEMLVQSANNNSDSSQSPPSRSRGADGQVVEIVRPEAVDPNAVIYSQQLLHEMHLRQYYHQYQMYLQRQDTQEEAKGTGEEVQEDTEVPDWDEGKLDDPSLLESSFKYEMDNPTPIAQPSAPPLPPETIHISDLPTPPVHGDIKEPSAPSLSEVNSSSPSRACEEAPPTTDRSLNE